MTRYGVDVHVPEVSSYSTRVYGSRDTSTQVVSPMNFVTMKYILVVVSFCCGQLLLLVAGDDLFECPETVTKALNDEMDYFDEFGGEDGVNAIHRKHGLQGFRDRPYGGRGSTYNQMKENTRRFKKEFFGNALESGDLIYESACGEGFNLLMTLEHLEDMGITNLTAYGNDYVKESADIANAIFEQEAPHWKGKFCQGDSANLAFVPSDTFDLAYTGFIDPLADPMQVHDRTGMTYDELVEVSRTYCHSEDEQDQALVAAEQLAQEEWYSKWTIEMLRIVKPGKTVIIEDVGYPLCDPDEDHHSEWGGIPVEWWPEAVKKYGWDADPDSVVIALKPWYFNRYNVVMRRKSSTQDAGDADEL